MAVVFAVVWVAVDAARLSRTDGAALFTNEETFLSGTVVLGACVTKEVDFLLDGGDPALDLRCFGSSTWSTAAGVTLASIVAAAVAPGAGEEDLREGRWEELPFPLGGGPSASRANSRWTLGGGGGGGITDERRSICSSTGAEVWTVASREVVADECLDTLFAGSIAF